MPTNKTRESFARTILITSILILLNHSLSLAQENKRPNLKLYFITHFDSSNSNKKVYDKYFRSPKGENLADIVNNKLRRILETKLEGVSSAISIEVKENESTDKGSTNSETYAFKNTLFVDDEASLNIKISIIHLSTNRKLESFRRAIKSDLLKRYDWWDKLEGDELTLELEKLLHEIATSLVALIDDDIYGWILQSIFKIRVQVLEFDQLGGNRLKYEFLEKALASRIEAKLAGSETVIVYNDSSNSLVNYIIHGNFIEFKNQLLINIVCIKSLTSQILASRTVKMDSLDLDIFNNRIAEATDQLRRKMEEDFRRFRKTLAVVANPPISLFSFRDASSDDVTIVREIVRTLTQKLRLLTVTSINDKYALDLKILVNNEKIINKKEPIETLSDLDVDYLVVVNYANLGNEVRLTANLYSRHVDRPIISEFIDEKKVNKAKADEAINTIAISLIKVLCNLNLVLDSALCDLSTPAALFDKINEVRMPEIRRLKGLGIRFGAVVSRINPELYLDHVTTEYLEIFLSYIVPNFRPLGLDFGIEPTFGYERGGACKGCILPALIGSGFLGFNVFINFKTMYSGLQYSNLPIIFSFGGGLGFQGIKYRFSPGDEGYLDSEPVRKSIINVATNLFWDMELPLKEKFRIVFLVRRVFTFDEVTSFRDLQFDVESPPVGKLDAYYFALGLKLNWR